MGVMLVCLCVCVCGGGVCGRMLKHNNTVLWQVVSLVVWAWLSVVKGVFKKTIYGMVRGTGSDPVCIHP